MKAKIYTKTGDKGQTSLVGGTRVAKTDPRLDAYGTLDELNSVLGMVRSSLAVTTVPKLDPSVEVSLQSIQNCLFNIGSHLACEDASLRPKLPQIKPENIERLEVQMDQWESQLPPLKEFILPGGSVPAANCHLARTICRRAERELLRSSDLTQLDPTHLVYINRLSDWLFLLARRTNAWLSHHDLTWDQT